ncbi:MAG: protein kinase [Kofleriaceae bacterium]|nr:protein kinase [Kofleriaceae bacterium]
MSIATLACTQCRTPFGESALFCAHCGSAKPHLAHDDLIGKVLGERFTILQRIGGGVSGDVYRAEHVTLRRKVAVKVLHHELSRDDLAIERFRREATTVAEIDNEHIVEIHDFGRTHDGRLYMAMELLEGESLDVILQRDKQLSVERTTDILIQVSEALMEAHAIGYVHRDLRPRNIFLAVRRGQANFVKLLDFGLAKLVDPDQQAASTSLGMTFGDPRYMSPEQARGDRIDRRADIYQLGCIAYEMLTGHPPFTGERVFDILSKQVTDIPAPLPTKRPGIPLWVEATVTRMLAKNPDNRFATTTRLVEALRRGAATGEIMDEEVARRRESVPPASVSRVMQKLGLPLADDVAPAPALTGPAAVTAAALTTPPTATNSRATQLGTPSLAPATSALSGDTHLGVPQQSNHGQSNHGQSNHGTKATAKGLPAVTRGGGPTGTPYAGTAAIVEPASAYNRGIAPVSAQAVTSATAVSAVPVAAMMLPSLPPTAALPIPQVIETAPGAAAAVPGVVHAATDHVADQSGVSSVWFAEGDQADHSAPLPRRAQRDAYSTSATDLVEAPNRSKRWWIVGGVLLLLTGTAVALIASSGSDSSDKKPTAVAIVPVDASTAAVAIDAPLVDASIDAVVATTNRTTPTGGTGNTGNAPIPQVGVTAPLRPSTGDAILDRRPASFKPDAAPDTAAHPAVVTNPTGPQHPTTTGVSGTDQTLDPYASSATPVITTNNNGSNAAPMPQPSAEDPIKQAESLAFIGEQALASGDAGGAAANFRKALELNPRNLAATLGLGDLALQQGSFGDAISHFRKATRLAPRSSRAFTLLGEAQLGNGNKDNAAESFKQALTLDADNARARNGYQDATR